MNTKLYQWTWRKICSEYSTLGFQGKIGISNCNAKVDAWTDLFHVI